MVTFADLRDARAGSLDAAADAWRALSVSADDLQHRCVTDMTAPLRDSGWQGTVADQAFTRLDVLDDEFEVAAIRSRTIASVLRQAAEDVHGFQRRLTGIVDQAHELGLYVGEDGRVHASGGGWVERHDPDEQRAADLARENAASYTDIIRRILDEATAADTRIATALEQLMDTTPGQFAWEYSKASDAARAAAAALGLPEETIPEPGTAPDAVDAWWDSLTEDDRQVYLTAYPNRLGALDGMPATDRDYANRLALRTFIGDGENHQDTDSTQHRNALTLLDKLEASENTPPEKQLYLLSFDPAADGKAAVAIGNPDTAGNTALLVPGVGTELDDIRGQINRADRLYEASVAADRDGPGVSVIAWLGYDTPTVNSTDIVTAPFGAKSEAGGQALDSFVDGLRATHDGPDSHMTVIGHSYGSTVVGEAASTGDGLAVDNIVAVGSPGMRVEDVSEFNVPADHVYAAAAADDSYVARSENTTTKITAGLGFLHGPFGTAAGLLLEEGVKQIHGPAPHDEEFGARMLSVDTSGHSGYWDGDSTILRSQAGIIVGNDALIADAD